jgi:hypothetical protein
MRKKIHQVLIRRVLITGLVAAAAAAWTVTGAQAGSSTGPRAEFTEFGIFKTTRVKDVPQPVSVSGRMSLVANIKLLKSTRLIVGQLGRSFGFRYRLRGLPPGARVSIRTMHPKLTHPVTGKAMTYSLRSRRASPNGALTYTGFTFDHRYELAEGIWKFQIIYRGKVIGEQSFKVVLLMN